ncbi:hypothetical protein EYZ11_011594 [Aspergillus tanneri]|uniref:Major facilitator superfamily (MFS) profile domain-containing protein n=1 Tax=Aspergillus tanneri TaxID=1220188 RepID=A0A4V3UMX0_9EURO|nr:hypothetical protein EYZ11_011594 [Aspergillus tanneri]
MADHPAGGHFTSIYAMSASIQKPDSSLDHEKGSIEVSTTAHCSSESRPSQPYTTFTARQRALITLLVGFATITSPLTATVYFPLLPTLKRQFHISAQEVNLTLTIYIIFQALSPALFGPVSDIIGRRQVYLVTLAIYALANLGMALNKAMYSVLMLFRALQSLGASAAFAISYGIVADICVPSERGTMMGRVSMALNLGTCIGPILGGLVAFQRGEGDWIFWALLIVGVLLFLLVGLFLPETARHLVGNGTQRDPGSWSQLSWWMMLRKRHDFHEKPQFPDQKSGLRILRPRHLLAPLRIIFHRDALLCLWMHGSFYAVDYTLAAAVPDIYHNIYGFSEMLIGLSYLPRGVGIICGGYLNGRIMDYNYRVVAQRQNWTIDRVSGDDLTQFPIELARTRDSFILLVISTVTLIGCGWTVERQAHFAILLVLQLVQGFWGTSAAAASVVRCAMAATAVSLLEPLIRVTGWGWYFTVLGLWSGICGTVAVLVLRRFGLLWRQQRMERETHS